MAAVTLDEACRGRMWAVLRIPPQGSPEVVRIARGPAQAQRATETLDRPEGCRLAAVPAAKARAFMVARGMRAEGWTWGADA